MKNYLFYVLTFIFAASISSFAQSGNIKGSIKNSDGLAIEFASIGLKGHAKGTTSNTKGEFELKRVIPGKYTLVASHIGFHNQEVEVTVQPGETIILPNIILAVNTSQLQEVTVQSNQNKSAQKESEYIARMPLKNLENPQVYNVAGKDLIKEQIVTERTDLYINIPGAVPNFAGGGSQGMSIRGFANLNGMRNGLVPSAVLPLNPVILERVEVLKGPSGALFGSNRGTTFGGVFNYVTKKPFETFGGEISYTAGSFEFGRIALDINTPLNEEKTALLRLNTATQTESSFQDQGYSKNYTIAPSFSYQVNDRLKFLVDVDITRSSYTTSTFTIGSLANVKARSFKDLKLDYKRSLINNGVDSHNGVNNFQAKIEYKLSDKWKSETNYLLSDGFYEQYNFITLSFLTDSTVSRTVRNQMPETWGNIQFQQNFIGDFAIGSLRNRMVVGIDYSKFYYTLNRATVRYDTVNINKPLKDFNIDKINDMSYKQGFTASNFNSVSYGLYASDVINLSPTLMAMLSLRLDRFTTQGTYNVSTGKYSGEYNQTSWSPKLGLVYQPLKDKVSIFMNYMNGFVNIPPVSQPDNTILTLKPQYGNQLEGGVKLDIVKNKLSGSISYYDISVTNSTRTEVINGQNFTVQDGTQNSRGYEVELIANPVPGLNIIAGYANNENKYTKAAAALEGKSLISSPKNVANIWVSYYLTKGPVQGLGLGAGGNYVSDSWFESTNVFVLPSYTLLNASVFYDQSKYRLSIKGNNLLNEQYWNSNGSPQKTINFLASVAFKF